MSSSDGLTDFQRETQRRFRAMTAEQREKAVAVPEWSKIVERGRQNRAAERERLGRYTTVSFRMWYIY